MRRSFSCGDPLPVRDARGEAGLRRRVPHGEAERTRQPPHVALAETRLEQRMAHAALGRGAHTRAARHRGRRGWRRRPPPRGRASRRRPASRRAAAACTGSSARAGWPRTRLVHELGGGDLDVRYAELAARARAASGSAGRRHHREPGRDGDHRVSAERARGEREDEARVDAARERDARGAHVAQSGGHPRLVGRHAHALTGSTRRVIVGASPQTGQPGSRATATSWKLSAAASYCSIRS